MLKGLAGLQAGVAAPGGVIDFIVKRPTSAPLRTVTVETRERGTLYGAVDLGGRLEDTRFGYRVNVAAERLRSYIKGADGNRKFISGAFDWQISPQALLQLDADYQDKAQATAPGFQLLNNKTLPTGISADAMLNLQPWTRPVETVTSNIGLRFQYAFNDDGTPPCRPTSTRSSATTTRPSRMAAADRSCTLASAAMATTTCMTTAAWAKRKSP